MIIFSELSVDELRTEAQEIINNTRQPDVAGPLASRGWEGAETDVLQGHLDAFADAAARFDTLRAQKDAAAQTFDLAADAFRRGTFKEHVDLADAAFTGDAEAQSLLGLTDGVANLDTRYRQWHPQATDFYARLLGNEALVAGIGAFNVTPNELQAGADEVGRLNTLYETRNRLDTRRQQARRDRDALRTTLETELRRFQKLARVVLQDTPDLLEGLGFVVTSD